VKQHRAEGAIFGSMSTASIEVSRGAILVLVAGERFCVEEAIETLRSVFPDRRLLFICEPFQRAWLRPLKDEDVFVVHQPFNPFGRAASEIRRKVADSSLEACALIIAASGFESVRLRTFALRLPVRKFVLTRGDGQGISRRLTRLGFLRLAATALAKGQLRKFRERVFSHVYKINGPGSHLLRSCGTIVAPFLKWKIDRKYERIFCNLMLAPRKPPFALGNRSRESINFVIGTLGPGGSERQLVTTVLGVAGRGYRNIDVLCDSLSTPMDRFYAYLLEEQSISISELKGPCSVTADPALGATGDRSLRALSNKLPPELSDIARYVQEFRVRRPVIVHSWLDNTNVKAGLAALLSGVPRIVLSTRSVAPNHFALFQPYMRAAYRILAQHECVCFLNNSEAGARDYERWLGLPAGTFKVIPNAIEWTSLEAVLKNQLGAEFRKRFSIPPDVAVVGSVFRFSEEKCPLTWIKVAEKVNTRRDDVRFLLIGDGPLREEVWQYARLKGFGDRVFMPGHQREVLTAIAAMDAFLLTSRLEGLPNVLIEAQGLGVPVVTTRVGGAPEALLDGKTGFAVASPSVGALADAVLKILGDRQWLAQARNAGPQFIHQRFSVARMVDRTLDAYFQCGEFQQAREFTA